MVDGNSLIVTLIASPPRHSLNKSLATEIAAVFGTKDVTWLAHEEACEFSLVSDGTPEQASKVLNEAIADRPVDFAIQHSEGRRKKALIADMDSTMIEQECIDELAAEIGVKDKVAAITARAMNGEIAFEPALRERVALLGGLPESVVEKVIAERITLASGGKALVATMKANGAYCALVSGGFTRFTGPIAEKLGFDENRANILESDQARFTGKVREPILGADAKVEALIDIGQKIGIAPRDFIAVGDGANDLPMLQKAGTGVALHAKPSVAERAKIRINHGDLTALLFLQGYRREEFVLV